MTRIEELEQKLNEWLKTVSKEEMIKILEEEGFEVIDKESKKEGKWKPQLGEDYWFRNDEGSNVCRTYNGYVADTWRYNNIPIFKTQSECEKYWHFMDTVKEKSFEFSKDTFKEDSKKYYIYYSTLVNDFSVDFNMSGKCFGIVYFKTKEDAWYIINNFKEELLTYWL